MLRWSLLLILAGPFLPTTAGAAGPAPVGPAPKAPAPPRAPLLVIGIDGASWDVVDRMVSEGRLPNLEALIKGGTRASLASLPVRHPNRSNSASIWTTLATGVSAKRHGIEDFLVGEPGERRLAVSSDRRVKAFWNILSEHGRSVGVAGWWATWPAEKVDGIVVAPDFWPARAGKDPDCPGCPSGSAPGSRPPGRSTYPESLAEELEPLIVRETDLVDARAAAVHDGADYRNAEMWPYARDLSFMSVSEHILSSRRFDVFAVYLESLDLISHTEWSCQEPSNFFGADCHAKYPRRKTERLARYYQWVDSLVGKLVSLAGPNAAVMVVSDHGFQDYPDLMALEFKLHRMLRSLSPEERRKRGIDSKTPFGHSEEALFILKGPGVKPGGRAARGSIDDVAPTILYLQGLPYGADMDGRPLLDAFEQPFQAAHPPMTVPSYETPGLPPQKNASEARSEEEERALRERLKAAGYLED